MSDEERKALLAIPITIAVVSLIGIICIQNVRINNLEKESIKLTKIIDSKDKKIQEVREENKRYLDQCLFILQNNIWNEPKD